MGPLDLSGRNAVVTGGANGIGRSIARLLSDRGANIAILDLDEADAEQACAEIGGETERIGIGCDVSDAAAVADAFERIQSTIGGPDILVNNAGVTRDNLIHKMSVGDWDAVMAVHLRGAFLCSQAVQTHMVRQRYGKIVMISSRAALGNRGQSNYSAAKAGLQGMARTMAIELGRFDINVNVVAPGHIDTAMTRAAAERMGVPYQKMKDAAIEMNAIKRVGTPDDIAEAVGFLVADEASYITGQVLYVAGRPTA